MKSAVHTRITEKLIDLSIQVILHQIKRQFKVNGVQNQILIVQNVLFEQLIHLEAQQIEPMHPSKNKYNFMMMCRIYTIQQVTIAIAHHRIGEVVEFVFVLKFQAQRVTG